MKMWLTTREIADLALTGMPARQESVIRFAERAGWTNFPGLSRSREARGGGAEYHVNLLPPDARIDYFARFGGAELAEAGAREAALAPDVTVAGKSAVAMDARLAILGAFAAFRKTVDVNQTTAISYFADLYSSSRIDVASWVRAEAPRVSARTLARWLAAQRSGAIKKLAVDRGASRRGAGVLDSALDGRVKAYALALIAHNPRYSASQLRDGLEDKFGAIIDGQPLPGLRAVVRTVARWREQHQVELLKLTNPDAFTSRMRIAGSYAHTVSRLNELWQIDASPVDALCVDGRYSIYACVDVWSRRLMLYVTKTPRSEAVQLLMRRAIKAWGAPERVKTDNGSDFIARATTRLFAALNIEAIRSDAFSPWQKGVVERAIRTFQEDCCTTLPGFIGHSVADRKVIEARKSFAARLGVDDARAFAVELTAEQLQRDVDTWAETVYAHRPHGGIEQETPFARAARSAEIIRRVDDGALHLLCMPAAGGDGTRTVGKQGLRIDRFHYLAPGLVVGDRVFVRLDPADMGRVFVFDETGDNFLAEAICPELAGVDRAELIAQTRAAQKKHIDERTKNIRAEAREITPRTMVDGRARVHAERSANLVAFPKRAVEHQTPAIDAATIAMRDKRAPDAQPLSDRDSALLKQIEAELSGAAPASAPRAANVKRLRTVATPQQNFRRFLALKARVDAGEEIPTADAVWFGAYAQSSECRSMQTMHDQFGEAALS